MPPAPAYDLLLRAALRIIGPAIPSYNRVVRSRIGLKDEPRPGWRELDEVVGHSKHRTDISDHAVTLFAETVAASPSLIVELGVADGSTTYVFERAARVCGAKLVSVDLEDCSRASDWKEWIFVQADDIEFAHQFGDFYRARRLPSQIDVLFIDTSHLFEHTVAELDSWTPFLAPRGKVILHDTNLRRLSRGADRTIMRGWKNDRGVAQALEGFLGAKIGEKSNFDRIVGEWLVRHWSHSFGLTVVQRLRPPNEAPP